MYSVVFELVSRSIITINPTNYSANTEYGVWYGMVWYGVWYTA